MLKVPDIIPVTHLRRDAAAALKRVRRSKQPLVITQRGRAAAVMLSVEEYERAEHERQIFRHLARASERFARRRGTDYVRFWPRRPSVDRYADRITPERQRREMARTERRRRRRPTLPRADQDERRPVEGMLRPRLSHDCQLRSLKRGGAIDAGERTVERDHQVFCRLVLYLPQ